MISPISAKFLIGKLPSRCQDQRLSVALRVVDALQRSNDLTQSRDVEQIPPSNWKSWTNQIIQSLWIYLLSLVFLGGLNHKRKIISLELSCFFGGALCCKGYTLASSLEKPQLETCFHLKKLSSPDKGGRLTGSGPRGGPKRSIDSPWVCWIFLKGKTSEYPYQNISKYNI